jgi:hypothetical protein
MGQRIAPQRLHLGCGEPARLPGKKIAECEAADGDPFELMHLVAEAGQHPADFAVLPLVEHHLQHRALLVLGAEEDVLGPGRPLGEADTAAEVIDRFRSRDPGDLHEIALLDPVARMGEEIRQFAVVGDEDQPLAHPVEPTDGEQPLLSRHEIDHARPPCRIEVGRHHADRFVDDINTAAWVGEPFTVNPDFLPHRIDTGAQHGDDDPIHLDATRRDQFLAGPSAADPCGGEHLLEALPLSLGEWWAP